MIPAFALALAAAQPCAMAPDDHHWIDAAVARWQLAERTLLKLPVRRLPGVYAADARCTYRRTPRGWQSMPHGDTITFPAGGPHPVGPVSFAAPAAKEPTGGFFAMTLPSVWRQAGVKSELGLERLMDGVMLHESMHARQFYFATPWLDTLTKRYGLPDDINDDSLQDSFKGDLAYVAAYEKERDTLFAAAAAPSDGEARRLAADALAQMRARRARFFTGAEAKWAPLDDLFLQMEGLGQWLAYTWYVSPHGANLPPAQVLPAVRRKGKYWTQDEGLALILTIDRLVPGWQRDAFAAKPALAEALLAKAAGEPPR